MPRYAPNASGLLVAGYDDAPLVAPLADRALEVQLSDGSLLSIDLQKFRELPEGLRERAMGELRTLEEKLLWNPLLRYNPASCQVPGGGMLRHPPGEHDERCKHHAFHAAGPTHHLQAFIGGNRAAKTTTAIVDDIIQATPAELLPPRLLAYKKWECPFYCRIITPDLERTMKPVIHQKLKDWLPKELLKRGSFDAAHDKNAGCLRLECGCRFDFLSYEMHLDKFGGAALHRVHYDEQPPKAIRVECLARLMDYGGDELFSLTPLKGLGFIYREIWKKRNSDPSIYAVQVGTRENPTLNAAAVERVAAAVTDATDQALRLEGKFMSEEGKVIPGAEVCKVAVRPDAYIQSCENVVAIDPGIRFAGFTYTAYQEDNHGHTWRAVKRQDFIAADYAREIRTALASRGLRLSDVDIVIDPKTAVQRGFAKGENILDELAEEGIYCILANNNVETGIREWRRRVRNGWWTIEDPDLGGETVDLLDELEEYLLERDTGKGEDEGEFKVVKMDDHVCDSQRYNLMHRPWLPETLHGPEAEAGVPWWQKADPKAEIARMRAVEQAMATSPY